MAQGPLAKLISLGVLGNSSPKIMIQLHSTDVSISKSTNSSITLENELIFNISIFFFYHFSISDQTSRWIVLFQLNYYTWQNEKMVGSYGRGCWISGIHSREANIRIITFTILYMRECICKSSNYINIKSNVLMIIVLQSMYVYVYKE